MKILAALDFSIHAQAVLDAALETAKWKNAECIIYTAVQDLRNAYEGVTVDIGDRLKAEAEKRLESALQTAKAQGVNARVLVEIAVSSADKIIGLAEKEGVDLVVMGSGAKSGLDRFLIGSVTSAVVSHAKCFSVLVVRQACKG
jgi:nucleotide-binding universal stress UspA family protein